MLLAIATFSLVPDTLQTRHMLSKVKNPVRQRSVQIAPFSVAILSAALSTGHCHCFVAKRAVIIRLNPLVITMAYSVREAFSAVKIVCSGHVSGKYSCDQFNGGCKKL